MYLALMHKLRPQTGKRFAILVAFSLLLQSWLAVHTHADDTDFLPKGDYLDCPVCALGAIGSDGETLAFHDAPAFDLQGTSLVLGLSSLSVSLESPRFYTHAPRAPPAQACAR
ncbi:MAG: hypothetical protein Cons2KO_00990 [Congregibacter sp.]